MLTIHQRPFFPIINRTTWLLWIMVCAVTPILFEIVLTALGKTILKSDPNATLISWSIGILIIGIPLLVPFLQWLVLRRIAPGLWLLTWFAVATISTIISMYFKNIFKDIAHAGVDFSRVALKLEPLHSADFLDILGLPWLKLLFFITIGTIFSATLPALVLGKNSGRPWYLFLCSAIIGSCFATIIEHLYFIFHFHDLFVDSLNGKSWSHRIEVLSYKGSVGALWGVSSGFALNLFFTKFNIKTATSDDRVQTIGFDTVFGIIFVIIASAPIITSLTKPNGLNLAFQTFQKVFSFPPAVDRSTGKDILHYAHNVESKPPAYPVISFAPDSKSFVMIDADRKLLRINVETGATIAPIGEPIGKFELHDRVWSPDGKFFVLRTNGEEVEIPNTNFTRHRSRFRVYTLPAYKFLGEYTHRADDCYDDGSQSMAFENDSKSLWFLCGQFYSKPKPDSVMAVKLDIPSTKVLDIHQYGDNVNNLAVSEIYNFKNGVFALQRASYSNTGRIVFIDLSHNRNTFSMSGLTQQKMLGGLTLQYIRIQQNNLELFSCGNSSDVSEPTEREVGVPTVHGFCRTLFFDMTSGQLVKKIDDAKRQRFATSSELVDSQHNLLITTKWQENSKAGEMFVQDINGHQFQKIDTIAQRLIGLSPDNKWLVTYAFDQGQLRIYRNTWSETQ